MPYCGNCGSQVNPNEKFCGKCGAALNKPPVNAQPTPERLAYSPSSSPPPPPPPPPTQASMAQAPPKMQPATPTPQMSSESTVGVILLRKPKPLGRYDTYTGVVTNQRLIFAQMTNEMLTAAVQQSREQAKAEGKGFWGQWADQFKATFGYTRRYLTMPPAAILAETPGNFALNNNTISEIKVKVKDIRRSNEVLLHEFTVEIHSTVGKYEYNTDENSDYVELLKQVYGERVKTPFGYFSKTINIGF